MRLPLLLLVSAAWGSAWLHVKAPRMCAGVCSHQAYGACAVHASKRPASPAAAPPAAGAPREAAVLEVGLPPEPDVPPRAGGGRSAAQRSLGGRGRAPARLR